MFLLESCKGWKREAKWGMSNLSDTSWYLWRLTNDEKTSYFKENLSLKKISSRKKFIGYDFLDFRGRSSGWIGQMIGFIGYELPLIFRERKSKSMLFLPLICLAWNFHRENRFAQRSNFRFRSILFLKCNPLGEEDISISSRNSWLIKWNWNYSIPFLTAKISLKIGW